MTAFPFSDRIERGSYRVTPVDGSEVSEADDGSTRIRRLYGSVQHDIEFEVFGMTQTDRDALVSFYNTNKNTVIEWIDPFTSITYDVLMLRPPRVVDTYGTQCSMDVRMRGTEQ